MSTDPGTLRSISYRSFWTSAVSRGRAKAWPRDIGLCRAWLLEAGLDPHDAEVVLQDYYSPERVAASVRADSFPTLKLMERVGVLDHPTARPAFVGQKLID